MFEPRPTVRLSAAFDRELGGPPGCAGRRPTSSGHGSRAPWRGGASWADRSASSGLSGILSIRPRGRSVTTPKRHANAPGARKRTARRRPADDRPRPRRVSNTVARAPRDPPSARPLAPGPGDRRRSVDTPREYDRIALRRPSGRCYPLRALGAGDVRGSPPKPETDPREHRHRPVPRTAGSELARPPRRSFPWPTLPINRPRHHRIPSTNGRKASLAGRPGRAPGLALAGEFRDVAARHPAGRCRRATLPDRRPERVRQGLARVALPLADQPDAGPDRRLQRPGRIRHRHLARARPTETAGSATGRLDDDRVERPVGRRAPAGPPRTDPGRWRGRDDLHQPALHLLELHRRVGQPPGPRGQPVRRRATGPRLQPALPVRRGRPRQDPPDARHRQPGHRQVPAQARRLRDEREVHQRVHRLDPAGQDRRVPRPLPADRPAPHR